VRHKPVPIDIDAKIRSLGIKEKLGQMFLTSFIGTREVSPEVRELNGKGLLGGIIFFSGCNVVDVEQLRGLTSHIQGLVSENPTGLPYLITLDQEGGQLSALYRGVTVFPGQMALGRADDLALTRAYAGHVGRELAYAGITTNFAPVLDVSIESVAGGARLVDNRMLSPDPEVVARHGVALVQGIQAGGVMACAKHYPGMRLAERDTHHQADVIDYPMAKLEREYLPPFRAAVKAGIASVMMHHAIYSAIDDKPVSLSKPAIDLLRRDLGFQGLVITDDLIMKAVQDHYPGPVACEMAINAGADLLILTGSGEAMLDRLVESVRAGRIAESTIDAAMRRIFAAKNRYVIGAADAAGDEDAAAPRETKPRRAARPDIKAGERLALTIARKSVRIESDGGGVLPLRGIPPSARISVILANPARLVMSDTVNFYDISLKAIIERAGFHPRVKEAVMPWNPTDEESLSLFDIGFTSDVLIFTTVNAYRFGGQLEVLRKISGLRREGRTSPLIVAVATRSPDDVRLLSPLSDAVLSTAGITEVQMKAVVELVFGRALE
jgi:beta-N-acetylhexosaminidase